MRGYIDIVSIANIQLEYLDRFTWKELIHRESALASRLAPPDTIGEPRISPA
jgi:hypothetical protein